MGIRTKIVLLTAGIMSLAIGAIIFASSQHFIEAYSEALQSHSLAVGKSLKVQLDRLLHLGIRLENIVGFDEQCQDIVNQNKGIRYALVTDIDGRVIFHSDPSKVSTIMKDAAHLKGVKRGGEKAVRSFVGQKDKTYSVFIPVFDPEGKHVGGVGIGFPEDLISSKTRKAAIFSIKVGLLFLAAAIIMLLSSLSVLVTKPLTRLLAVIQEMREKGEVFTRKVEIDSKDEIGQVATAFNMMTKNLRETTVSKKAFEHQATHDELTGLPNRNLLADRLEQAILMANRHKKQVAVFFMDLDNFKFINDSLGHNTGDQVLKTVAERLKNCVRASDTVSRQAGDEFVIVLTEVAGPENTVKVANKIIGSIRQPFVIENHDLTIRCSIGISIYPKDGKNVLELMKSADTALYRAKEQGKNSFQFFTSEMNARLNERMKMEGQLRLAIEKEEFVLFYQPKVCLKMGQVVGTEALIRWQHPDRGILGPADFIPLAEETGLIEEIGEWVLKTACRQAKTWRDAGMSKLPVAVNVSVRQFKTDALIEKVRRAIDDVGLDPDCVELEVTESLMMLNTEKVQSTLQELKDIGIRLALDDFGTGYSSLGYLQRFPFDKLKLDRAFVRDITRNPDSAAIARSIIAMAQSLNLKVIAEGVETEAQVNYLRLHGCEEMQGYYFSQPLPASDLENWMAEGRSLKLPSLIDNESPQNTLLLVDDDADMLATLKKVLKKSGFRILTAANADEGFELLAKNRVGLVVSDHNMPGMKGSEFLTRVRSLHPSCVRIAMTGYADLDVVMETVNRGAIFKFMTKPFTMDQFKETINEGFKYYSQIDKGENRKLQEESFKKKG